MDLQKTTAYLRKIRKCLCRPRARLRKDRRQDYTSFFFTCSYKCKQNNINLIPLTIQASSLGACTATYILLGLRSDPEETK